MIVREVAAKSILNKSGIADYAVNCYTGCAHGCAYCYARFMQRFTEHSEAWGDFVDVKVNSVEALRRQVAKARPGRVFMSSVCDGWQPVEGKRRLTRECLALLVDCGFGLHLLTKSTLARRDFDIMQRAADVSFGVTVTTVDEPVRRMMEPRVSTAANRLDLVKRARDEGIRTHVFMGPLLPWLSDRGKPLERLVRAVAAASPDEICVDRLNPHWGLWNAIKTALGTEHARLLPGYRRLLFSPEGAAEYVAEVRGFVGEALRAEGLLDRARVFF